MTDAKKPFYVLGLTGSIGMGKSTVSQIFRDQDVPVLDADQVVHDLYAHGGAAVGPVSEAFPSAFKESAIDRRALSTCVVGDEVAIKKLEAIVHPLVSQRREQFLKQCKLEGRPLVVLDIPLLYESGAEAHVDAVAVVSAPAEIQESRVLARPGMTTEKFKAILSRQVILM
ncbi:hypothetical protein CEUSTIGMA_g11037.t1 [Chlamydomonas eustigma]|uniref:Dephospho-CoA kinase n=1 Tax=Chlamydomonas eustigma TaxID=1157962 RepID=A0A250XKQ9_9CHLO|nr:hypothetical protein CEUSTIGMA_g11037.t1 [Chlamydomonas eustigma]|eukprot:GAX83613.1 hypothetical protein CEUSTIGMA_g11037.t1 [Chlamydomonas eustigma]